MSYRSCCIYKYIVVTLSIFILVGLLAARVCYCSVGEANHFENGKSYFFERDYNMAVKEFKRAQKQYPNSPEIAYNLGLAFYQLGKLDEAINYYKMALKLKPNLADAQYNLGVAYNQSNQIKEAISAYNKALMLLPNDSKLHFNLGLAKIKNGDYIEAKKEFEKALELDPNLVDPYNNLGYLAELEGNQQLAIAFYKKALSLDSEHNLAKANLHRLTTGEKEIVKTTLKKEKADFAFPFSLRGHLGWTLAKDIDFDDGGTNTITSKDASAQLNYSLFDNRINMFLNLGITSKGFDDLINGGEAQDETVNYIDFSKILGLAGGGGINFYLLTYDPLKLGIDAEIGLKLGKNEGEKENDYIASMNWMQMYLSTRCNYLGMGKLKPYAGISISKLDGTFEIDNLDEDDISMDFTEANLVGLFLGASYKLNSKINVDAQFKIIDETSIMVGVNYQI